MNTRLTFAVAAATAIFASVPAIADQGYTISNTGTNFTGPYNLGYEFSTAAPISVTDLGYYAPAFTNQPTHDVGLYATDGTLLVSTTVLSTDTQDGAFIYKAITPLNLAAGSYVVDGTDGNGGYQFGLSNFAPGAGITIVQDRYNFNSVLSYANYSEFSNNPLYYTGANFRYGGVTATPEPGQYAILGIGVFSLAMLAFKARRRSSQLA